MHLGFLFFGVGKHRSQRLTAFYFVAFVYRYLVDVSINRTILPVANNDHVLQPSNVEDRRYSSREHRFNGSSWIGFDVDSVVRNLNIVQNRVRMRSIARNNVSLSNGPR